MKNLIYALTAIAMLSACGSEEKQTEKCFETEAEIEAAMMQGREAGRMLVNREWKDTLQLQGCILDARAERSKYEMANKPECAKAFDKGFVSLVYTVKPDLAKEIFPDSLLKVKE